jgi:acyl transferase domain-containing protein/acyl carrier protein
MADEQQLRSYLKRVTIELAEERKRLHSYRHEPVAIVGMSCRYPGGVGSPEELWDLVAAGRDGIGGFPTDRGWDTERLYDPDPDQPGTLYVREGGFIDDPGQFDAGFFEIGPREALAMDPQQRLLLEVCWEALEDAGLDPTSLRSSPTGVFAGVMYQDYATGLTSIPEGLEGHLVAGTTGSVVSGRIAYALGLEGPAITLDTACSSSLVTIHLAAQALRRGEISLALAGGVTVLSSPNVFIGLSRQRGLSPDGRCKAFSDSADGVGWAEGVGMLALERLSDAERNGHPVLATIRGSAVNQDGASNGLTAPNGPSQERVIREALANARLTPQDIDAVEAHGTGTTLGDPIEAGALLATYGQERERALKLGSIKSNIGHTQAAAGVAGVIKTVIAMREGVLPKTLHVDRPSSNVDWSAGQIELLTEAAPWEADGNPRRAAVSSFGISGTNAHLILERAPAAEPVSASEGESGEGPADAQPLPGQVPTVLSAKSEAALREAAGHLAARLESDPALEAADVAYSLATTRTAFERRAVVSAGGRQELLAGLRALQLGQPDEGVFEGRVKAPSGVAFIFPGQGSQWQGMGLELAERSPVFARRLRECEEALSPHIDFSPRDVLAGAEGAPSIERIEVVQPVLFAVMVALAELWRACGVAPAAVAGHSQGEIAAAHVAGGLTLEDAAMLAAVRSRIISKLAGQGGMVSVALPAELLSSRLERWDGRIEVAAQNGPLSTIASGDREALDELLAQCEEQDVRAREIPAAIASHSAHVEGLREELLEALAPISPREGEVPFYSTVSGELLDTRQLDAEYWYRNLRERVRFEQVTRELLGGGLRTLIEISPHPVFALAVRETVDEALADPAEATVLGTLRRDDGGAERFAASLAQAHAAGAELDWEAIFAGAAKRIPLPTYRFQRERYWLGSSGGSAADPTAIGQAPAGHPLLAAAIEDPAADGLTLTGRLSLATHPWIADHAVGGAVLLPGTAFVEMALRAGAELDCQTLEELTLQAPLLVSERGSVQLQISVGEADGDGERPLAIYSRPQDGEEEEGAEWTRHAEGILGRREVVAPEPLGAWPPEGAEPIDTGELYERLAEASFDYGPAFQGVVAAWSRGEEVFAEVSLPAPQIQEAQRFGLHPALLDCAFHAGIDLALSAGEREMRPMLPFAWRGVRIASPGAASLRVRLSPQADAGGGTATDASGLTAFDPTGAPVVAVESVLARTIDPDQLRAASRGRSLFRMAWSEAAAGSAASAPPDLAILGEAPLDGVQADLHADLPSLLEAIGDGEGPGLVLADFRAAGEGGLPEVARERTLAALELVQGWLAAEPLVDTPLVLLTAGAIAAGEGDDPDLASAPICGLLRSAHSEHPGRFRLLDLDGTPASLAAIPAALAVEREPQLALREGTVLAPRLVTIGAAAREAASEPIDPETTVLITGGTSGLGARVARHLAENHGVRHLLLLSRRGPEAPAAAEIVAELAELGAGATVVACDVSDRSQLQSAIAAIPEQHPLGAVVHSAAVLDDGVLEALDAERLERVFAPKAEAAWHLHELTKQLELSQFIVFSSSAGLLGGAAQANYAAANAFLDALATHRRAQGLPGTALAWGMWVQRTDATLTKLDDAALERMASQVRLRLGFSPMSPELGLELFDAGRSLEEPLLAAATFDTAALRAQAKNGTLQAILRGLVPAPARREGEASALEAELAAMSEEERRARLLEVVRGHAAAVLGHASAGAVEPDRPFKELGFDSLGAVELRNRLSGATGLRLAPALVFDYPTAVELAGHLAETIGGGAGAKRAVVKAQASDEPIAIVGISCRYPGGVSSPDGLWSLLSQGRDAISAFPSDRGWDLERLYDPDPDNPGTSYARGGGFLDDAPGFDRGFFGIGPQEALAMDPQQRLLLEASWETLEDAGIDPRTLRGSQTGVFAGVMYQDYGDIRYGLAPGMSAGAVTGRVAYTLGLEGPTMTVDTACSSSLVALHLASQALRGGECSLALAGGVTVFSTPGMLVFFSYQRGLSADGRSKAFAEAADGVGLAEGVGMLVLERLSDAERNGHTVLATIRGSAVNQDGASNGLTAPNGPSQERVIRQALANARLEPQDVDAVEAHGTGTTLGDPIEAGALLATYGQDREAPLKLGSLKSNIGHAQAAAGVGGVIKMVLAMREGVLPKTLHVDSPSSKVDWESGAIELLTEAQPWEPNGRPRRAGVSSFGASGTNAHAILEEAPAPKPAAAGEAAADPPAAPGAGTIPLVLSARSEPALRAVASRLLGHLRANPELDLADVAWSLVNTRSAFERRAVALGEDRERLLGALESIAGGEPSPDAIEARAGEGKLAYLFTGQGSQRAGMGRELYGSSPRFAAALDRALEELDPHLDRPLRELLFADPGSPEAELLDHTTYAQPALFALQVALFEALRGWGLAPDLLAGHSIGEISAAHLAGVFSLADAAKLVAARGRLMGALPEGGAMLALQATEAEAVEALAGRAAELSIAAINAPRAVVISGEEGPAEDVAARFGEQGRKTKRLAVSHAFHSPRMEPMLEEFAAVAGSLTYHEPKIPIVSNVSGELLGAERATDPAYWVAHVREPVRFADAVASLEAMGAGALLELGPDPVLTAMAAECLEAGEERERPAALIATLREGRPEARALTTALVEAHACGAKLDWDAFFAGGAAKRVALPIYPFQRQRYWLDPSAGSANLAAAGQAPADHPLLGAAVELASGEEWLLTGRLSLQTHPWLADHTIAGTVLLPGTAFVELALTAGERAGAETIEELVLQAPLFLPERGAVQIQVSVSEPDGEGRREVAIHSRPEEVEAEAQEWIAHATGILSARAPEARAEAPAAWPPAGAEPIEVEGLYDRLADAGFDYGPAFQGLTAAWQLGEEIFAEVSLDAEPAQEAGGFSVHPALMDSIAHAAIGVALEQGGGSGDSGLHLPFAWRGVRVAAKGAVALRVRASLADSGTLALDESGAPVFSIDSVLGRPVDPGKLQGAVHRDRSLYRVEWPELQPGSPVDPPSRVAVLGEGAGAGLEAERYADLPALLEALEAGAPAPEIVVSTGWREDEAEGPLAGLHAATSRALALVQDWVACKGLGEARLVLLTEGAVAVAADEEADLATAPLWGLLRSAQSEHLDRFVLIDVDGSEASSQALPAALGVAAAEPQLAIREGRLLTPRLDWIKAAEEAPGARPIDPGSTVLITGGTGGIGALIARHLVASHGVRHLLLLSRSGEGAEGAVELRAELEGLGAQATLIACDVGDRDALAAAIDSIPAEHPLGAVYHLAGVIDDGVLESLDGERLRRVFAPKADAAWHLHELTAGLDLSQLVFFSSASGIIGNPAQANYAAANTFLNALAVHRRARGLPATSLIWGGWAIRMALHSELEELDFTRHVRLGYALMSAERGLELFEAAMALDEAQPVPLEFDRPGLRAMAADNMLPPVLRRLVRAPASRERESGSLARQLAGVPAAEREAVVLELVRSHAATALGLDSAAAVEPERAFQELGLDSLGAVELRNRLGAATGLRLAPTLIFDYPSAAALARHLLSEVAPGDGEEGVDPAEAEFRQALAGVPLERLRKAGLMEALMEVVGVEDSAASAAEEEDSIDRIDEMDIDDLVEQALEHQGAGSGDEGE